jgi:superfamily II DNA/RNA helicase
VAGDFAATTVEKLMAANSRIIGDAIDGYRRHADHRPAICFVATVRHGEAVAAQFRTAGYRAACIHGGLPAAERNALIAGLDRHLHPKSLVENGTSANAAVSGK